MQVLENLFARLSVSSARNRRKSYLVGFADTEGAPHRSDKSNLWEFACVIDHIYYTDGEIKKLHSPIIFNVSTDKNASRTRKTHQHITNVISHINHIKTMYEVDDILLLFWGAGHDQAALKKCFGDKPLPFCIQDLLTIARSTCGKRFTSYSLENVFQASKNASDNTVSLFSQHSALGDTFRLQSIFWNLGLRIVNPKLEDP